MKTFKNVVEKVKEKTEKVKYASITAMVSLASCTPLVFAADENPGTLIYNFMDRVLSYVVYLGYVLVILGGVEFGISMKDDNANKKTEAVRLAVAGAIVVGIKWLVLPLVKNGMGA